MISQRSERNAAVIMEALPSECRERKLACIPFIVGLTYDLKERYLTDGYGAEEVAEIDAPMVIAWKR